MWKIPLPQMKCSLIFSFEKVINSNKNFKARETFTEYSIYVVFDKHI